MSIKSEYRKIRKRVLSNINRYKKLGFDVQIEAPKIPKRITQGSINRLLKQFNIIKIKESSFAPRIDTGEIINAKQFQNIYRGKKIRPFQLSTQESIKTPSIDKPVVSIDIEPESIVSETTARTRLQQIEEYMIKNKERLQEVKGLYEYQIIDRFKRTIFEYPENMLKIVNEWFQRVLSENDISTVADMIKEGYRTGSIVDPEEAYKEGQTLDMIHNLMGFLDISAGEKRAIIDSLSENTDFYEDFY